MKKTMKRVFAGSLAAITMLGALTIPVSADTNQKGFSLHRFVEDNNGNNNSEYSGDYSYTPAWVSKVTVKETVSGNEVDVEKKAYVEPNYFRTSDGEVAYCLQREKAPTTSGTLSDETVSKEVLSVIQNGYPAKKGSDYGFSDQELEWATTFAVKAVAEPGNSWSMDDFDNSIFPISEERKEEANKIKELVGRLINCEKVEKQFFALDATGVQAVVENDFYKVGPYKINTNLTGVNSMELVGAPASASTVLNGSDYYITIPAKDVSATSALTFQLVAKNSQIMVSDAIYKPEAEDQQKMYVCGTKNAVATAEVVITPERNGVITIQKNDENGKALKGTEFTIYDINNKEVGKIVSDEKGIAKSEKLPLGDYTVKETKATDGFIRTDDVIKVSLVANDKSLTTEFSKTVVNQKNSVEILKVEKGSDKTVLKDGQFEIYKDGKLVNLKDKDGKTATTIVSDRDGKIIIKGLADGSYTIKEVKAPAGYKLEKDKTYSFAIDEYGKVTGTTKIENEKMTVTLKKTNEDDKGLKDATIEVREYDSKDLVFVGNTKDNGEVVVEKLNPGKYTVKETKAPSGYQLNEDTITFEIDAYGNLINNSKTKIVDKPTTVTITKKDKADNKSLSGAKIIVKNSDGKIIFDGTTDSNGEVIIGKDGSLAPGNYVYYEETAPEGYIKTNEKSTFTINSKGECLKLTLYNTKLNSKNATTNSKTGKTTNATGGNTASGERIKTGEEGNSVNVVPYIILGTAVLIGGATVIVLKKKKRV